MIIPYPMPLIQQAAPFDDPNFIYEIKYDGFRALAVIENGGCRFVSRNGHPLYGVSPLSESLARELCGADMVLDGELAVTDNIGRTLFASLMQSRKEARYFAFDLVWINGEDLRKRPLLERKARLKKLVPSRSAHVLYVDHVEEAGTRLYQAACELDLEGIVAKRAGSPYEEHSQGRHWVKIKNPRYSQKEGRGDLFKRVG